VNTKLFQSRTAYYGVMKASCSWASWECISRLYLLGGRCVF